MKLEFTKESLVEFFKHEGYKAIAKAIESNDNAVANARLGINHWYSSLTSKRYFPQADGTVIIKDAEDYIVRRAERIKSKVDKMIVLLSENEVG